MKILLVERELLLIHVCKPTFYAVLLDDRCTEIQEVKNAYPSTVIAKIGTEVTFHCEIGYEYPGGMTAKTVECGDGVWNDTLDDCEGNDVTFIVSVGTIKFEDGHKVIGSGLG